MQRSELDNPKASISINDIYQYVFGDAAKIDVSKVPANLREERRVKIQGQIKEKFAVILESPQKNHFRKLLRELKADALELILFNNITDTIEEQYTYPNEEEIKKQFIELNNQNYFFSENDFKKFLILFKGCKLIADYVEDNNSEKNEVAYHHAYKMLVLFGCAEGRNPFSAIEAFISNHNYSQNRHPIHDVLVNPISTNNPAINLSVWRRLIQNHGVHAIDLFQLAGEMRKRFERDPSSIQEAETFAAKLQYTKANLDSELAKVCRQYNVSEEVFNKCLEIKTIRKTTDNLPNLLIDGNEINHKGYYLAKLPIDDPRAFILGHITNCCQSIGGNGEQCVIDGLTRKNNGFYVLLKSKQGKNSTQPFTSENKINYIDYEIVGQGYAWLSRNHNLVLDSWENLRPESENAIIIPFLQRFGIKVNTIYPNIWRVTIGQGGKTPGEFTPIIPPEIMLEGKQYGDSTKQSLIFFDLASCDNAIKILQKILNDSILPKNINIPIEDIISFKQFKYREKMFTELFFNPQNVDQWRKIFSNNDPDFKLLLANKSLTFWKSVYYLAKVNMFNMENIKKLLRVDQIDIEGRLYHFCNVLDKLDENNKVNPEIFNCIFEIYEKSLGEIFLILEQNNLLTSQNLTLLKSNASKSDNTYTYYDAIQNFLNKYFVIGTLPLSDALFKKIMQIFPEDYLNLLASSLDKLKSDNLLTEENLIYLLTGDIYSLIRIWKAISHLSNERVNLGNTFEIFKKLPMPESWQEIKSISIFIAFFATPLNEHDLINDENINLLLSSNLISKKPFTNKIAEVIEILKFLKRIKMTFNADIKKNLLEREKGSLQILEIFEYLINEKLLDEEMINKIMAIEDKPPYFISTFNSLKIENALSSEIIKLILNHKNPDDMSRALYLLTENKITLTKSILSTLSETASPSLTADAFIELASNNLLSDEYINMIIEYNSKNKFKFHLDLDNSSTNPEYFVKNVLLLKNLNLFTDKNKDLLMKKTSDLKFTNCLHSLYRHQMLDQHNLRILKKYVMEVKFYSSILLLAKANMLTQKNLEILVKLTGCLGYDRKISNLYHEGALAEKFEELAFKLLEKNSKKSIKDLKKYILSTNWREISANTTAEIVDDKGIKHPVPADVKAQWEEIVQAENQSISYYVALNKIKQIANQAGKQHFTLFGKTALQKYYKLFDDKLMNRPHNFKFRK